MSTVIRPEITKKSKYYISKERYYELKHFCLQYGEWKEKYHYVCMISKPSTDGMPRSGKTPNMTEQNAIESAKYSTLMQMVDDACDEAAGDLSNYIFVSVTEGRSYEFLRTNMNIPCCKDVFYDLYRRFYWVLDKKRD